MLGAPPIPAGTIVESVVLLLQSGRVFRANSTLLEGPRAARDWLFHGPLSYIWR